MAARAKGPAFPTPGPWRVNDSGMLKESGGVLSRPGRTVCPHCRKPGNETAAQIQILAKGWGVAQLGSLDPAAEYEQHLANARLISAAPDGLALAEAIVDYFGDEEIDPLLTTDITLRDMARALVAKTRGEA